ncbi:Sodium-coupled monocarboxylate transporter 1 [Branchiostoma belcheri]|nr:Sodium-coupled monocarboxylate transporter 1 [Branchiostoma belcheri]
MSVDPSVTITLHVIKEARKARDPRCLVEAKKRLRTRLPVVSARLLLVTEGVCRDRSAVTRHSVIRRPPLRAATEGLHGGPWKSIIYSPSRCMSAKALRGICLEIRSKRPHRASYCQKNGSLTPPGKGPYRPSQLRGSQTQRAASNKRDELVLFSRPATVEPRCHVVRYLSVADYVVLVGLVAWCYTSISGCPKMPAGGYVARYLSVAHYVVFSYIYVASGRSELDIQFHPMSISGCPKMLAGGHVVRYLSVADYVVFSVLLAVSAAIGLYYACTGGRQRTQREFLMADRSMSVLPVTISAITVLGTTTEIYMNMRLSTQPTIKNCARTTLLICASVRNAVFSAPHSSAITVLGTTTEIYTYMRLSTQPTIKNCARTTLLICASVRNAVFSAPHSSAITVLGTTTEIYTYMRLSTQPTIKNCARTTLLICALVRNAVFRAPHSSAITVLGTTAEIYTNGTMYWNNLVSSVLSMVVCSRLFLPVFFDLGMTSTYEYLEKRFSKSVRRLCSFAFMINMVIYMGLGLYAPALALSVVTGMSLWGSILSMGIVCTFYTTIGGMKAVMWTDTFQVVVMVTGFLAVIIQGSIEAGGLGKVWDIANSGHRLEIFNFDPDPRVRHTNWNIWVGGVFVSASIYGVNQAQVQRYLSCPSLAKARTALYLNIVGIAVITSCACLSGLVIYARYHGCDPLLAGAITSRDQILPYFVMDILSFLPGMPGLFVACVASGALSTLSSGLNSLAAVTLEDFVKPWLPKLSDIKYTTISKALVLLHGVLMVLVASFASLLGPLAQAAISVFGMISGPILGIFILGMMFPCANSTGGLVGLLSSLVLTLWIGIGSIVWPRRRWLPPVSTHQCPVNFTATTENATGTGLHSVVMDTAANVTTQTTLLNSTLGANLTSESSGFNYPPEAALYQLSYAWLAAVAVLSCVIIGLAVSFLTDPQDPREVSPRLIIPVYDRLFCCLPERARRVLRCGVRYGEQDADDTKEHTSAELEEESTTAKEQANSTADGKAQQQEATSLRYHARRYHARRYHARRYHARRYHAESRVGSVFYRIQ